jgi:hypothetical protein
MSNQRFIQQIRNYAKLAARFRRSYADQVQTLYEMRAASVWAENKDDAVRSRELAKLQTVVATEYGRADAAFKLKPYSG